MDYDNGTDDIDDSRDSNYNIVKYYLNNDISPDDESVSPKTGLVEYFCRIFKAYPGDIIYVGGKAALSCIQIILLEGCNITISPLHKSLFQNAICQGDVTIRVSEEIENKDICIIGNNLNFID